MKRTDYRWKTFRTKNESDWNHLKSAWAASSKAFGNGKVMDFGNWCEIETNLSINNLRKFCSFAGVRINMDRDVVFDSKPIAEREKEFDEQIERMIR